MGIRSEFLAVGITDPRSEPTTLAAPTKPAEVSSAPPLGLIAGLALLTLLGGTMWYMVRQRAR